MTKVIITGANSFIGRRLCRVLTDSGYFVYAVVRNSFVGTKIFSDCKNLSVVYSDMEEYGALCERINGTCDIGIALAWNGTRGRQRDDHLQQETNYITSIECVKSFIEKGCKVIITAGSQAEYGPRKTMEKVKETDECNPNTEYGKYKLQFYLKALELCQRNDVRLIEPRFFSLYGPDDSDRTMIISIIRNMLNNLPCKLTLCVQLWDFLYIDDAVDALLKLLQNESAKGIYNFGSGISQPLKQYIELMHSITKSKSPLLYGAISYPSTGMVHTNPSITRLQEIIGWKPKVSFEEGIKRVIDVQISHSKKQYIKNYLFDQEVHNE